MISKGFLKSTISYSVAGSLPMLSGFILLPFYTNLLDTGDYGILMLYIAFSLFIQILVSYSIDAYMGAHYTEVRDNEPRKKELIASSAGLLLCIGVVFILTMLVIGAPFFDFTFNRSGVMNFFPYGIMSVVTGFFNSFFRAYTYLLIFEKKPSQYFLLNFANFGLTIILSLAGLHLFPDSLIGPMYGRLLSGAGIFLLSLVGFARVAGISFRFNVLKGLHIFCIPYVLYVLLTWLSANIDRFIINDLIDAEHVAIFDFAVKCSLLIDFVQTGMVSAIYPEVFGIWTKTNATGTSKETNRYFHSFTGLTLLFVCLFMVIIPLIIPLFVKKQDFYESFVFMGVLVGSFVTRGVYYYFVSIILHLKRTRLLLLAFAVSAVFQLPLTWILTKFWSVNGAVAAALFSRIIQVGILYLVTRRYFEIRMNVFKMVGMPTLLLAALCAIWYLSDEWSVLPYLGLTAIMTGVLFLQYRKEIKMLFEKFFRRKIADNNHQS